MRSCSQGTLEESSPGTEGRVVQGPGEGVGVSVEWGQCVRWEDGKS